MNGDNRPLTVVYFDIALTRQRPPFCPVGHPSIEEVKVAVAPQCILITFDNEMFESRPLFDRCRANYRKSAESFVLIVNQISLNFEQRRRAHKTGVFTNHYDFHSASRPPTSISF